MRSFCYALLLVLVLPLAVHAETVSADDLFARRDASAPPHLRFAEGIVAEGFTPGGQILWYGIARTMHDNTWVKVDRYSEVTFDDDGEGAVSFPLEGSLPLFSVWLAIDLKRGDAAIGMPTRAIRPFVLDGVAMTLPESASAPAKLLVPKRGLDVLWLRPGEGAWSRKIFDGGPNDEDALPNGQLRLPLVALEPEGGTASGERLRVPAFGDVVFLVDSRHLDAVVLDVVLEEAP